MTNHEKIKKIALNAVLMTLVIVLAFIPIRIGVIEITLVIIPLAIGAIIGGPITGLVLGATFGVVSFLQCLGYSPFGNVLLTINPFLTFLVCVPTRMIVGFVPGLIAKRLFKKEGQKHFRNGLISVLVPVLNTLLFTSVLILCFYNTEYIQSLNNTFGTVNPFTFAIAFVGINGLVEIIVGILVSFPVASALGKYLNK